MLEISQSLTPGAEEPGTRGDFSLRLCGVGLSRSLRLSPCGCSWNAGCRFVDCGARAGRVGATAHSSWAGTTTGRWQSGWAAVGRARCALMAVSTRRIGVCGSLRRAEKSMPNGTRPGRGNLTKRRSKSAAVKVTTGGVASCFCPPPTPGTSPSTSALSLPAASTLFRFLFRPAGTPPSCAKIEPNAATATSPSVTSASLGSATTKHLL